ncbi:hypothetical protein [Pseudomonas sp. NPDC007930]|uniref:hypothetical protein n=1 Tax=Pseudomonas sp. NPDC007930 TaxID=3364417 RepID=UPI0036E0C8A3
MKHTPVVAMILSLGLAGCATDGGGDGSASQMFGALMGVALGSAATYNSGSTAQGQQVTSSVWRVMGLTQAANEMDKQSSNPFGRLASLLNGADQPAAVQVATATPAASTALASAETPSQTFSFKPGSCPKNLEGARSFVKAPELLSNPESFSQTFTDMAQKAGGYDQAIAANAAQQVANQPSMSQARETALQVFAGPGAPLDRDQCANVSDGIYCPSVNVYWMLKDADTLYNYVDAGLRCTQTLQARK